MREPFPSTARDLVKAIDQAWEELQSFLGSLNGEADKRQDASGWTVKDHVTHMAIWEDSVAILFRGSHRHVALGVEEAFYKQASFDQINAVIQERYARLRLDEAVGLLDQMHKRLMSDVRALTDEQLATAVRDFFPLAPRADDRRMSDFIYWNTADHFREHLPWMRSLTGTT